MSLSASTNPTLTLVFDTETTGLPPQGSTYQHPQYPDALQLGMVVLADRFPIYETSFLINHLGNELPVDPKAFDVHGITPSMCRGYGMPVTEAMAITHEWMRVVHRIVAHNASFDIGIWRALIHKRNAQRDYNPFATKPIVCTMRSATEICALPKSNGGLKPPKLIEAFNILVDPQGFPNAHNALADVWATIRVLWQLEDRGITLVGPTNHVS